MLKKRYIGDKEKKVFFFYFLNLDRCVQTTNQKYFLLCIPLFRIIETQGSFVIVTGVMKNRVFIMNVFDISVSSILLYFILHYISQTNKLPN